MRGETPALIAAAAEAMRARDDSRSITGSEATLDTCGTGGDGLGTLNVSTAAAIVAASLGIAVAKHGNRAVSSRAGSADVLEALGVPIDLPADRQAGVLREAGIAFLFAQSHHPAMKHAAAVRRELGIRTIFNVLGPLCQSGARHPPAPRHLRRRASSADGRNAAHARNPASVGGAGRRGHRRGEPLRSDPRHRARWRQHPRARRSRPRISDYRASAPKRSTGGDAAANAKVIEVILRGEPHPGA